MLSQSDFEGGVIILRRWVMDPADMVKSKIKLKN